MLILSLSPLCPAGDTIQPTADGTANFPLFLHTPDELYPFHPAQLSISSEDAPEAARQPPRSYPNGRRWASIPLYPGIWVSPQPWWGWGADLNPDGCQRRQVSGVGFIEPFWVYVPHGVGGGGHVFVPVPNVSENLEKHLWR